MFPNHLIKLPLLFSILALAAPDIYMALERNMIQGIGWPIIGLHDAFSARPGWCG